MKANKQNPPAHYYLGAVAGNPKTAPYSQTYEPVTKDTPEK